MNPFDAPPSTPPVGFDPPQLVQPPNRGRGRMAFVALASAGLVVGGVAVVSQLASADRPETVAASSTEPVPSIPPETAPPTDAETPGLPEMSGQITIDLGNGPITIDLGEVSDCIGQLDLGELNLGQLGGEELNLDELDLSELDLSELDLSELDLGELNLGELNLDDLDLGELNVHGAPGMTPFPGIGDGAVTVAGPDGLSVIEFGEGDGSVTITNKDGELTVTTDGDVEQHELDDLFGGPLFHAEGGQSVSGEPSDAPPLPALPDFSQIEGCLGDLSDQLTAP